jgi:hypothetical protein
MGLYEDTAAQAQAIAMRHLSPRYRRLHALEAYVDTTQYEGRADFFDGSENAPPVRERRPCIQYPIVANAIDSNVDLVFGEGRFPTITVEEDAGDEEEYEKEDDGDESDDSEPESTKSPKPNTKPEKLIGGFKSEDVKALSQLVKRARLRPAFRLAFEHAQGCGTAVAIGGVRNGVPFLDIERAKWCTPEFDQDGKTLLSLEIQYPYTKELQDPDGNWRVKALLYRRRIDATSDVTFAPLEAPESGRKPRDEAWKPAQSVKHGLGFCPVVWYPFMIGCTTAERIDGRAIHARCLDEIFCLDMSLSQRHRAAFYTGDPQLIGYGLNERGPSATGRMPDIAGIVASQHADPHFIPSVGKGGEFAGGYNAGPPRAAVKKGPGEFWQIDAPPSAAKIELLTLPANALDAIDNDARDLRFKVSESLAVVFSDPETSKFAASLSGKAQKMLRARQLDRCDKYRDDLEDGLVIPCVMMLARVVTKVGAGVRTKKLLALAGVVESELSLKWGDYFDPDADDEIKTASFVNEAEKAIPLPDGVKIRKLQRALGVDNPSELEEAIHEERERRSKESQASLKAEADAFHAHVTSDAAIGTRDSEPAGREPNAAGDIDPKTAKGRVKGRSGRQERVAEG